MGSRGETGPARPGRRLRPEDLPPGVRATRGYDQRGACLTFAHDTLGELGKIVLVKLREDRMLVEAELYIGPEAMDTPLAKQKQRLFEQVVATVKSGFLGKIFRRNSSVFGIRVTGYPFAGKRVLRVPTTTWKVSGFRGMIKVISAKANATRLSRCSGEIFGGRAPLSVYQGASDA